MRIRKNTTLSSLLLTAGCGGERPQTHVCHFNQSPWDVIPFTSPCYGPAALTSQLDSSWFLPSSSSSSPRIHQFDGDDSFNGNVSLGDSSGAAERVFGCSFLDNWIIGPRIGFEIPGATIGPVPIWSFYRPQTFLKSSYIRREVYIKREKKKFPVSSPWRNSISLRRTTTRNYPTKNRPISRGGGAAAATKPRNHRKLPVSRAATEGLRRRGAPPRRHGGDGHVERGRKLRRRRTLTSFTITRGSARGGEKGEAARVGRRRRLLLVMVTGIVLRIAAII
ncbi:PREDICTED: uncharacterized protein LOC104825850 isoform X2 [Tarenaya hassleriana]|uniref:uncharacterized protein LOC104825850 isoform X2 n=1 Tax=Tarenaya hassleriana TaxID=28532 RepID=UPI00053C9431|nr:PREDICTED: uncharacterized protein LOC104825850 isoform X2 [Tarenaya hassleriana]